MDKTIEIEIRVRSEDFHAQIAGHPEIWAAGRNPQEAIGDLVKYHSEKFGIKIVERPAVGLR
jgi:hypothetical protein